MAGSLAAVRDYLDRGRGLAQDGITEKSPVCARMQASICLPKRGISCSVKTGTVTRGSFGKSSLKFSILATVLPRLSLVRTRTESDRMVLILSGLTKHIYLYIYMNCYML
jgi:hypothetical protein